MQKIIIFFLLIQSALFAQENDENHLLICGVCRNVSKALDTTMANIEALGSHFKDYAVVIYENNSVDDTASRLAAWAKKNSRVLILSETLSSKELALARCVRIANARNRVLQEVRKKKYEKYKYLVMCDLDFQRPWPIQEIVDSIKQPFEWDSIAANGITSSGVYYDRFAFRNKEFPFGAELLDYAFWHHLEKSQFRLSEGNWPRVYSAFGGLAIYKTDVIKECSYSGTVTKKLKKYYKNIIQELPEYNDHLVLYQDLVGKTKKIHFRKNCMEWQSAEDDSIAVCEHVTLHAEMALKGHGIFYVNPRLIMQY